MAIHLSRDLENLQRRVLSLASAVEQAVEKAMRALFDRDVQLAKNLVASDTPIDMEENQIEEVWRCISRSRAICGGSRRF